MNIYIDFDHTLFNTTLFIEEIEKLTNKEFNNLSLLEIKEIVINNNLDLSNYLYHDTLNFLNKYKDYNLYLLTHGKNSYQEFKIKESKIDKYFKDIIITKELKGNLNLNYKDSIFIDDNPIELDSIYSNNPIKTIRIRRGKYSKLDSINKIVEVKELLNIKLWCIFIRLNIKSFWY